MTIKSQIFTTEQASRIATTEQDREMLTSPATEAQIRYIMTLIWNKGANPHEYVLPASTYVKIPTAADLAQYNRRQASKAIEHLQGCPQNVYGLQSLRRSLARDEFGYATYLGDLSDTTKDI